MGSFSLISLKGRLAGSVVGSLTFCQINSHVLWLVRRVRPVLDLKLQRKNCDVKFLPVLLRGHSISAVIVGACELTPHARSCGEFLKVCTHCGSPLWNVVFVGPRTSGNVERAWHW